MCADKSDIHDAENVVELYDQSVLVSSNIEHDAAVANNARVSIHQFHIVRGPPVRRFDLFVPGLERLFSVPVALPVIPESAFLDNPHATNLA